MEIFHLLQNFIEDIHARRMQKLRHRQRLQILEKRLRIAEALKDPIELLVADRAIGGDFDRRLRIALDKDQVNTPEHLAQVWDPEIDGELEEATTEEDVTTLPHRTVEPQR